MNTYFCTFLLCCLAFLCNAQNSTSTTETSFAIYPGCENEKTFTAQKTCFGESLSNFISAKYDTSLFEKYDLDGVIRIYISFIISKDGTLTNLKVHASHPALSKEGERVIKMLPKITPANRDGNTFNVPYVMPVVFTVH